MIFKQIIREKIKSHSTCVECHSMLCMHPNETYLWHHPFKREAMSGEIFGHNRLRSECLPVQPVLYWHLLVFLYKLEVYSLNSSKVIDNFPKVLNSTSSFVTNYWFSPFIDAKVACLVENCEDQIALSQMEEYMAACTQTLIERY